MTHKEIKDWFRTWYMEQKEPVPLNVKNYMLSPDIRIFVLNSFKMIDNGKVNSNYIDNRYELLELVKEAIENKSHDISDFGWTVFDKWIENGQDQEN